MAAASGLALLANEERDPRQATSFGTGQVLAVAAAEGPAALLLGVGGSATNDLGLGALTALGLEMRDRSGSALGPLPPARWGEIGAFSGDPRRNLPPLRIACDVENPLLGPNGALAVYGPQKGLQPSDYDAFEAECARLAMLLCRQFGQDEALMRRPGAGAAGGIAFGLMAATGASLLSGIALMDAWLDLDHRIAEADLVITGEGRFDTTSLAGKGPGAVARRALALGKEVHVFAGQIRLADEIPGLQTHAISPPDVPLATALANAEDFLATAAAAVWPGA
jgi:glycerate kinase